MGRADELAVLGSSLEEMLDGTGDVVFIEGAAGMGKTRLAGWLSERGLERGAFVARARSWEGVETPPYWPWVQVLRQMATRFPNEVASALPDRARSALGTLIPDLVPSDGTPPPDNKRFALFDAVATLAHGLAASQPLVFILEDIHAADEPSLLMLQFLSEDVRSHRILMAVTADETAVDRSAAAARVLREIERSAQVVRLGGLDEDAVARLYEALAGREAPSTVVQALLKASEGNPLFVEETTRMLIAEGDLHRADHSTGFRVPKSIGDIIRHRLRALSAETFTMLSIASVIGREFDATTLATVADVDVEAVLELLEEPQRQEVVREEDALGRYAFTHILIRETLYEGLTSAQRMRLHKRVADLLEDLPQEQRSRRLAEIAHHWFKAAQAGDPATAFARTVEAAEDAAGRGAAEEAVRLFRRALKLVELAKVDRKEIARIEKALSQQEHKRPDDDYPDHPSDNKFVREGEYWTITYAGSTARLRDSKGLRFLAHLLANPGKEIHVLELIAQVEPAEPRNAALTREDALGAAGDDAGAVLDATAKAAYKRRLQSLEEDIDEARLFNDPERVALLESERESLIKQISQAVGLGGRDRRVGSAAERARVSVTKTIKDALQKTALANPKLHEHLCSTVRTGTYCSYTPDPRVPIEWEQ